MAGVDKKALGRIELERQRVAVPAAAAGDPDGIGETDVVALKKLSEQHGVPGIDLAQLLLRLTDLELLPREIAVKHVILPVLVRDDRIFVAMADPREKRVLDELEFVTGKRAYPYVALREPLSRLIELAYERRARGEAHWIGPRCPRETLERAGIGRRDDAIDESFGPMTPGRASGPPSAPAQVVDDAVSRSRDDFEIEVEDFGDISPEHSVVDHLIPLEDAAPGPDAKTVLVVDDEEDIRKMLARLLSNSGYRVLEADRGLLAMRMVKEHMPDLIVLDAMLPEVHGFDIARRIKGSQKYGHIPIVMVSAVYRGWRYAEDIKASYRVDRFIEKPFRIADVVRAVEECLTKASNPAEDAEQISAEAEAALNAGVAAYKAGEVESAMEHLRRGISIDPLAYRLHFHLGLLYGKQKQLYEAMGELETAIEINPRHFPAVKNLAILYQKAGFRHKASEMWQRALALAPDEDTRTAIKDQLMQLL